MWALLCTSNRQTARCSTLTAVWAPAPLPPSLEPWNSSAWATPAPARPSIFPLDQALTLPARSFSYELQRRLVKAAVQNPFLESVQTIAELTGVSVSKRSLEEILPDAAQDFDAFYQQRSPWPRHRLDPGGGGRLQGHSHGQARGAQPTARLTKGQKANKKRMATVATVFTRAPWVRTPQQVIESLFPTSRPASG